MKPVYVIIPACLLLACIFAYPYLLDWDWLAVQKKSLETRVLAFDPSKDADFRFAPQKPIPPKGPILNEAKAKEVAENIWTEIYGSKDIALEKPLLAVEAKGYWHVCGTLQRGWRGGVANLIITKEDGRVIGIWHGQ